LAADIEKLDAPVGDGILSEKNINDIKSVWLDPAVQSIYLKVNQLNTHEYFQETAHL